MGQNIYIYITPSIHINQSTNCDSSVIEGAGCNQVNQENQDRPVTSRESG